MICRTWSANSTARNNASQGQTCVRVLIEADAHSLTANENTFYVAISRARHHAQIYTDDREMLPFAMSREIENLAALDIQDQYLAIGTEFTQSMELD